MIKKLLLLAAFAFSVGISADELNSGDTAWILTSTALVLFMTLPGLSLFYAGLVRSKNAISVLMQCFAIACIVSGPGLSMDTVLLLLKVMHSLVERVHFF